MDSVEAQSALSKELLRIHSIQRQSFLREGPPSAETRIDRIDRALSILMTNHERICEAATADFGSRSKIHTLVSDVLTPIQSLLFAKEHVKEWMSPEDKPLNPKELAALGCKARVVYQPFGVVGVIAPWNFPWCACFAPLAGILAAGNRAMIKPSIKTPQCAKLMQELIERNFDPSEIAVVLPGEGVNALFTAIPFDHLFFTGSAEVGKKVLRAASENLVPCTMELGGKNPVVVGPEADIEYAAERIMFGKVMNAGQICLSPDYVFLPVGKREEFIQRAREHVNKWFDGIKDNADYTSIIDEHEFRRLLNYLTEAKERNIPVEMVGSATEDLGGQAFFKIASHIVIQPEDDMKIMQEEVFGPLISLKEYEDLSEVISFINSRPRPLALYYFGEDRHNIEMLENRTFSGGMCINDVIFHAAQEELPFGGVGNSGMGSYHGRYGFIAFSHQKAVFEQSRENPVAKLLLPPYTAIHHQMLTASLAMGG